MNRNYNALRSKFMGMTITITQRDYGTETFTMVIPRHRRRDGNRSVACYVRNFIRECNGGWRQLVGNKVRVLRGRRLYGDV